jgi:hypothetical protein
MDTAELTLEDVKRDYPHWEIWLGINGLSYGRRYQSSPPAVITGEDPLDLRDQIRGWEGKHA